MSRIKYILFLLILTFTVSIDAALIRRAAFDFGSGKIKVQVADVDTDQHTIVQSIYTADTIVPLSEEASHDPQGLFSEALQTRALDAAQTLKQKAIEQGATEFRGLATEAYRIAPNGQDLIDRYFTELNIPVKIISQFEEGKNGFRALVAETGIDPAQLIVWDIGGGSFQVTYLDEKETMQVYMAPFGRVTTKNAIIKHIKNEDPKSTLSPNPMTREQWEEALCYFQAILPEAPKDLILKLQQEGVRLVGISAHPEKLRLFKTYCKEGVLALVEEHLNKSDAELADQLRAPVFAVSDLVLVYSIMEKLGIESVDYIRTSSGATSALLIDELYWHSRVYESANAFNEQLGLLIASRQ